LFPDFKINFKREDNKINNKNYNNNYLKNIISIKKIEILYCTYIFLHLFFLQLNQYFNLHSYRREEFNIIEESGNYDHWKYTVQYTEHLSHLPMIRNIAYGSYAVRPDNNGYVISSKHRTCFFFNFNCCK
jgi:hypothetical protein